MKVLNGEKGTLWECLCKTKSSLHIKFKINAKKVLKNASYLVIFACKCRLSLGASRNFRSHSVMLFTTDLKTLILFLSLLKKELCAVRAVSSLFLRLLLASLSSLSLMFEI